MLLSLTFVKETAMKNKTMDALSRRGANILYSIPLPRWFRVWVEHLLWLRMFWMLIHTPSIMVGEEVDFRHPNTYTYTITFIKEK